MAKVININMHRKLSDLLDNQWKFTTEDYDRLADKIHLLKEDWTSWCGLKSQYHKPLRLTTDKSKVKCEECLEAEEQQNVGSTT